MSAKPKSKPSKPATAEPLATAPSLKAAAQTWNVSLAVLTAAKKAGCDAFHPSGRIDKARFFQWLEENQATAQEAEELDLEKLEKAELEKEKLRAQIRLLRSRDARERKETIPLVDAYAEWSRAMAIDQEEARLLMDRQEYITWVTRTRARIGDVLGVTDPETIIEAIRRYFQTEK